MVTGMHMDERSIDCLVLGHHDQARRVSAKSVSMRAMTICKNLSGYRELLLICNNSVSSTAKVIKACVLLLKPIKPMLMSAQRKLGYL